jgi:GntR family transcriptional regulator
MNAGVTNGPRTADGGHPFDVIPVLRASLLLDDRRPRYEVVQQALERAIRSGELPANAVLPTELDLADALGISRQTVRHALNELTRSGLLTRRRGVGTFVSSPPIEHPLGQLSSFVRTLAMEGEPPPSRLLGIRFTIDEFASPLLTGSADGVVFEMSRIFSVEGEPFALERIFLPEEIGGLLPVDGLSTAVIDDLIRERAGIEVDRGSEFLELVSVGREEAVLMKMDRGDPAFLITRTAAAGERTVELRRSLVRGDRARFRIELRGAHLEPVVGTAMSRLMAEPKTGSAGAKPDASGEQAWGNG